MTCVKYSKTFPMFIRKSITSRTIRPLFCVLCQKDTQREKRKVQKVRAKNLGATATIAPVMMYVTQTTAGSSPLFFTSIFCNLLAILMHQCYNGSHNSKAYKAFMKRANGRKVMHMMPVKKRLNAGIFQNDGAEAQQRRTHQPCAALWLVLDGCQKHRTAFRFEKRRKVRSEKPYV